jgi:excisionase family DNA binding protein
MERLPVAESKTPSLFPPLCVRPKEAWRLLGVGRSHFYKLLKAGRIPSRKDGAATLIDYEALVAYRDSLPVIAPEMKPTGPLLPLEQQETAMARATEPGPDLAAVYSEHRKSLARSLGDDEAHFRAFDHVVNFCRQHSGCDLEQAKATVRAAIAKAAQ